MEKVTFVALSNVFDISQRSHSFPLFKKLSPVLEFRFDITAGSQMEIIVMVFCQY